MRERERNPRARRQRRRRSRRNPSSLARDAAWIAAGAGAFVLAGYGLHRAVKRLRDRGKPLPSPLDVQPPQGGIGPGGGPVPTTLVSCEIGPNYPGFALDLTGLCNPTESTPPGIYVDVDCQDFVFVAGDEGDQVETLEGLMEDARVASLEPEAKSADPTDIVAAFLETYWPSCPWPPAPGGPQRLIHLFEALSFTVGRTIVEGGGRVLGTSSIDTVDEQVAQRLTEMGLPEFDQDVVPEFPLSDPIPLLQGTVVQPPSPPLPEPGGPQGGIDLPGGQGATPGEQGVDQPADCAVIAKIKTLSHVLPAAAWTATKTETFKIWSPTSNECRKWVVAVGVCIRPTLLHFGELDQYVGPNPPADLGEVAFQIRRPGNGPPLSYDDWQQFRATIVDKQQFSVKLAVLGNGNLSYDGPFQLAFTPIDNDGMDACPNRTERWPSPEGLFYEVKGTDGTWRMWRPVPQIDVQLSGKNLMLRVRYPGLPVFRRAGNQSVARIDRQTPFIADVKVWSAGKE